MAFYVICDDDSKHESMTKEQIIAAIMQALENGSVGNCDTGFVTKIKEQNSGGCITFWVGTQAQYNGIEAKANNCVYIITDDTSTEDTKAAFAAAVKAAEAAKESVREMVEATMPIDITDKMKNAFTLDARTSGAESILVSTLLTRFVYIPSAKMVFFSALFSVRGSASTGKYFYIKFGDKYLPREKEESCPEYILSCSSQKVLASLSRVGFKIKALEDITNLADDELILTGWYFCEGE